MVRALSLFITVLLLSANALAQDETIMRDYARSTIANIVISFDDQRDFEERIIYGFQELADMPKYNISRVSLNNLESSTSREQMFAGVTGERSKSLTDRLRRIVADKSEFFPPTDPFGTVLGQVLSEKFNVGGLMMGEWATRDQNGLYPVVQKRTLTGFDLEDIRNNTDPNKTEVFTQSLRSNYVIVYDVQESGVNFKVSGAGPSRVDTAPGSFSPGKSDEDITVVANAFIYKVTIDDDLFRTFIRPKFDDKRAISSHPYKLTYVGHAAVRSSFSPKTIYEGMRIANNFGAAGGGIKGLLGMNSGPKPAAGELNVIDEDEQGFRQNVTWESLPAEQQDTFMINELTRIAFEDVLNLMEMNVEDFKVRAAVMGNTPIVAAIGKREGVRADQRYRVYENVLKGDEVVTRSVGVVRAINRVADNMEGPLDLQGEPLLTEFRQVFGDGVKEGMYMVQENDFGLGLSFGPTIGYFGSPFSRMVWKGRGYYNASRTINKILGGEKLYGTSFFIGLGGGSRKAEDGNGSFTTFVYEFGVEKKLYMHHRFDLAPELAFTIFAPGRSKGLEAEFADNGAFFISPGLKGLFKFTERTGLVGGIHIPLQVASIPYDNPASFLQFDLRVRTAF